jgi:hypothetical protein
MKQPFTILSAVFFAAILNSAYSQEIKPKFTGETRIYRTLRIAEKPKIDGVLDDACWNEGEWAGDFRQQMPAEGTKPSQQTKMKILYDNENIYVAFKCYDTEPDKTDRQLARRDEFSGDIVGLNFDSYHDRRTGFEFDLTAAGSKIDLILTNQWSGGNAQGLELNWNPVWDGEVGKMDSGWIAEMRIPLTQLRYSNEPAQVWGLHAWRWLNRNGEEDQWNLIPRDHAGALYHFGELHGLENLPIVRRVEFMPYTVAKIKTYEAEQANPFLDGNDPAIAFGMDGKFGIGSNFTVDYTINPDFGQVEADPSELNLTAFETYYEEKRPFFIEGRNIFGLEFDDNQLLYSRRIGHAPNYEPPIRENEYLKMPENTSILGALKLTGKTANGVSVGILESLTSIEYARVSSPEQDYRKVSEPLTNYFAGRVQKDINNSNTIVGGMITSTYRKLDKDHLDFLGQSAITGGVDFKHFIKNRTFSIDFKLLGSQIDGKPEALTLLQQESSRYYQRPDAPHLKLDTTARVLRGTGGSLEISKGANGNWRYAIGVHWMSPGLELNDMGFQSMADILLQGQTVGYVENDPKWIFRTFELNLSQINFWNFGGEYLGSEMEFETGFTFKNMWNFHAEIDREGKNLDVNLLRGGPGIFSFGSTGQDYFLSTDQARKVQLAVGYENEFSDDKISKRHEFHTELNWKISNSLTVSPEFNYNRDLDNYQYISNDELVNQGKYLLGRLDRKTYGFTLRASYALSPQLTIQYYGSPYVTMGTYSDFKSLQNPESNDPDKVFRTYEITEITYLPDERRYYITPETSFENPDFNFRQLRSNLVARWEYRPGSVFYLVWTHNRTSGENITNHSLNYNLDELFNQHAENVFLVKFNYWFSL